MDLMVKNFSDLNLKDNEIYLLGDFNINLRHNSNDILNRKISTTSQGSPYTLSCQFFLLVQLITCLIHVILYVSSLTDHVLTNATEKTFRQCIIESGISGHYLILCTRKHKTG